MSSSTIARAVVVGFLAVATPALARPGHTTPDVLERRPAGEPLSEGTALGLSLGGTLASYALFIGASQLTDHPDSYATVMSVGIVGATLAPSFGHWYAGRFATRGLGLRVAGGVAVLMGGALAMSACPLFSTGEDCQTSIAGTALLVLGGGLVVGGTIDDIVTAPGRVRGHNARLDSVALVPTVHREGGGVSVVGRF